MLLLAVSQETEAGSWELGAGSWDPGSLALTQCNLLAARLSCRRLGLNLEPEPPPPAAAPPPCALCAPPQAQRLGVTSSLAYMQCSIVLVSPVSPQLLPFQLHGKPKKCNHAPHAKCLCLGVH